MPERRSHESTAFCHYCFIPLQLIPNFPLYCFSVAHEVVIIVGCFENGTTEVQAEFDTEEVLYVDFDKQDMVYTVPPYLMMNPRETFGDVAVYNNARKAKNTCPAVVAYCKAEEKNPPEVTGKA